MADFLDEEDQTDLMNKYPWQEMHVITMHQEYAEVFQIEKQKRLTSVKRLKPPILKLF